MRQPTEEQKAAAAARREKFRGLWREVAKLPETARIELANRAGIRTVENHELSLMNQCLVARQNPSATIVGGFRQWIKNGRTVRKGEHGAMIWVPTGPRNADGTPESPLNGNAVPETSEAIETRFLIGTVFDVSQTEEIQITTP